MLQRILELPQGQRLAIFILIFGGGLLVLVLFTLALIRGSENSTTRTQGVALVNTVTVAPFAVLPDDDAYPAAVAVTHDGRVYSGSYQSGVLWVIDTNGTVTEIPNSRDSIGAVSGLAVAADGTVYVVDQLDTDPATDGGDVKRLGTDGSITTFVSVPDDRGFLIPERAAVDDSGHVYISDRGRDEVWRFNDDGSGGTLWWSPPVLDGAERYDTAGLAYDASHESLLVTDGINNTIYRVPVDNPAQGELLYRHGSRPNSPLFFGLTVAADGSIYVAALSQNGIARLNGDNLDYIAGLFRGASDVAYAAPDKLYVTNWDQTSLQRTTEKPFLPFTLDVIRIES
ncbi:MAG: hypothetical protein R3E39_17335 [Anaerolineae bacterium]